MVLPLARAQDYPKPSIYPVSWELDFRHGELQRIVVQLDDKAVPQAYWYLTYTVTNNTDREQLFLPAFDLVTEEGRIIRSDRSIPQRVFESIKRREGNAWLLPHARIGGELRMGEDEAKDGVAIWPEPSPRMGRFSIFASGLSGEHAMVEGPDGSTIILRKTLQLKYHIPGDGLYPGEDEVRFLGKGWVMR